MWKYCVLILSLTATNSLSAKDIAAKDFSTLDAYAFPEKIFSKLEGPRTDALLIQYKGKLIYSRYDRGTTKNTKHILWSVSKSITSLLFAIAENKGLAHRSDSICKHNKDIPKPHCQIRYQDLLQFSSGLKWVEEYEKSGRPQAASVLAMFYGEGRKNMKAFLGEQALESPPGSAWRYSSGDSMYLMALLPKIFSKTSIHEVVQSELFGPLGIEDWTLEVDGSGNGIGASSFYLRAEDLLKIGQLIINKGKVPSTLTTDKNQKQIFAKNWIDFILAVPNSFLSKRLDHDGHHIGGGSFWLNKRIDKSVPISQPWPTASEDTFAARGHWGQYLVVSPSKELIIVRFGDTKNKADFTVDRMIELAFQGLPK